MIKLTKLKKSRLRLINSLMDEIPEDIRAYTVLAGGALRHLFTTEYPSDFDLFVLASSEDDLLQKKAALESHFRSSRWKNIFTCPKGELTTFRSNVYKVQVINVGNKLYRSPEEIIESFDFDICCMAYHLQSLYLKPEAIKNIRSRVLTMNSLPYPSSTINRIGKYKAKGYDIRAASIQIAKMISDASVNQNMNFDIVHVD